MKKYFFAIFFSALFLQTNFAYAKNIRGLQILLASPQEINADCGVSQKASPLVFCYRAIDPQQVIFRSDIPAGAFPYIFVKGIGYYVLDGAPADIVKTVFRPGISSIQNPTTEDYFNKATSDFASWVMGADVGAVKARFFLSLLKN